ncbi:MAG: hypothetical protein E6Q60_08600 [Nitrosomonas oligotropha]|uniref:Uncharacterized protein n=1 Tax=Nitrosomonas oligotropha TaxID=42354 RepID=A0A5C7VS75_9PROT|nr:MAG: hypothetical protein E6Q60_08600 [Nitrosomonas oligotropha]
MMLPPIEQRLATELSVKPSQIQATVQLLDDVQIAHEAGLHAAIGAFTAQPVMSSAALPTDCSLILKPKAFSDLSRLYPDANRL